MPTPRPFNAPTTFAESPLGEINRQVSRMKQAANSPATKQGLSAFTQRILGIGKNALATGKAGLTTAGSLGGQVLMGVGLPAVALTSAATAPKYGGMTELTGEQNTIKETDYNKLYGDVVAQNIDYNKIMSDIIEQNKPEQQLRDTQAPDGSESKGTRTSPSPLKMKDVNTLLSGFGIRGFAPNAEFNSNQLPTTENYPLMTEQFSIDDARTMGVPEEDAKLMGYGSGVETVFEDGKESSTQIFKDPGSRAFLDYEGKGGSMGAFRAAERARGMVRVGGKNYITNPLAGQDGQSDFTAISDEERRNVNAGRITAQDLSNQYIQRITGADPGIVSDNLQTMGVPKGYRDALERDDEVFFDIGPDTDTVVTPIPKFSDPFSSNFDPNRFID